MSEDIEIVREKLNKIVDSDEQALYNGEALFVSQELDKLIQIYYESLKE